MMGDLLVPKGRNRRNRKIGLAGTGRANAHDVDMFLRMASMYFFWLSVFALTACLCRDAYSTSRLIADLALAVLRQPDNVLHGLCADGFSSPACHRQQRRNRAQRWTRLRPCQDFQLGSAADDRDVQFALDLLDVFVNALNTAISSSVCSICITCSMVTPS